MRAEASKYFQKRDKKIYFYPKTIIFSTLWGNARESQILAIGFLFFESLRLKKLYIGVKSRNIIFPKNFFPKKYLF